MKLARFSLTVLTLMVLTGCTVKLAYNNLDRMVRWQVDDFVDWDRQQSRYFASELDRLLYWHRTTQLTEYADRAEAMAAALPDGVALADVEALFAQVVSWYDVFEAQSLPMVTELLLSLSDEQVSQLPEAFAESNEEFIEDEVGLTLQEAQQAWMEQVVDGMKHFAGRLNREQKDYITRQSVRYQPEYVLWAQFRERWQAQLLKVLEMRGNPVVFEAALKKLIDERESYWGEEFAVVTRGNEALGREVLHGLLERLDDRQTVRFQDKLLSMAEDFRELAGSGQPPENVDVCLIRCAGASSQR